MKYSIEVYEDHALIKGWLTMSMLKVLMRLCKEEGFTYLTQCEQGFKLIKKPKEI